MRPNLHGVVAKNGPLPAHLDLGKMTARSEELLHLSHLSRVPS